MIVNSIERKTSQFFKNIQYIEREMDTVVRAHSLDFHVVQCSFRTVKAIQLKQYKLLVYHLVAALSLCLWFQYQDEKSNYVYSNSSKQLKKENRRYEHTIHISINMCMHNAGKYTKHLRFLRNLNEDE